MTEREDPGTLPVAGERKSLTAKYVSKLLQIAERWSGGWYLKNLRST